MANNSLKVSELPQASNVSGTDRVMVLYSPASNPSVRTITVANLALAIGGGGSANLTAVNTSITPITNNFSLGDPTNRWANLFLTTSVRFPNTATENIPSLTTRAGEKIILKDLYSQNLFSYSIGIEANSMWFGVDESGNSALGYKWYSGNTQLMKLDRDGHLQISEIHSRKNLLEDHFHIKTGANLEYDWQFSNTGTTYFPGVLSVNNNDNIYINNPTNGIQIGGSWLVQMSATSDANNLWGSGNTEAYAWVYQDPGGNGYAEHGVYLESGSSGENVIDFYITTDPERVMYLRSQYPSASPAIDTTLRYTAEGILYLPNTVGDIYRDGISVLGTGQIDGGNAFTTPTAEITVDGGGA